MSWVRVPPEAARFFLGKVTALGVLCCFALFVCLTLLASFFLPSHISFKNMYIILSVMMSIHVRTYMSTMHECTLHVCTYVHNPFFILTDYRSVAKNFSPSQTYIPWPLYERCHHTQVRDSNVIALHINLYCLMRVHLGPTLGLGHNRVMLLVRIPEIIKVYYTHHFPDIHTCI